MRLLKTEKAKQMFVFFFWARSLQFFGMLGFFIAICRAYEHLYDYLPLSLFALFVSVLVLGILLESVIVAELFEEVEEE